MNYRIILFVFLIILIFTLIRGLVFKYFLDDTYLNQGIVLFFELIIIIILGLLLRKRKNF